MALQGHLFGWTPPHKLFYLLQLWIQGLGFVSFRSWHFVFFSGSVYGSYMNQLVQILSRSRALSHCHVRLYRHNKVKDRKENTPIQKSLPNSNSFQAPMANRQCQTVGGKLIWPSIFHPTVMINSNLFPIQNGELKKHIVKVFRSKKEKPK